MRIALFAIRTIRTRASFWAFYSNAQQTKWGQWRCIKMFIRMDLVKVELCLYALQIFLLQAAVSNTLYLCFILLLFCQYLLSSCRHFHRQSVSIRCIFLIALKKALDYASSIVIIASVLFLLVTSLRSNINGAVFQFNSFMFVFCSNSISVGYLHFQWIEWNEQCFRAIYK